VTPVFIIIRNVFAHFLALTQRLAVWCSIGGFLNGEK
jgi:hypothetical protein